MTIKFAFAGFRHGHIFSLYNAVKEHADCEVVAACEEDAKTREDLIAAGNVEITHSSIDAMLAECDCDVVATGDYYAKRGSILIKALEKGKHVISDKPICTCLDELKKIEELATAKNLKVGCQLDLRDNPKFIGLKNIVQQGVIGEVNAISFGGQHPLMIDSRAGWYFEPGKHGGTINDIAIHGIDIVQWITGLEITEINAARNWNAVAKKYPHFKDAGQLMLTMSNGCGVLADVSYFAPDSCGYKLPYYWRTTIWGSKGVLETNYTGDAIEMTLNGDDCVGQAEIPEGTPSNYLKEFIRDIKGEAANLNTAAVIDVSRKTLMIQEAADKGLTAVKI